MPQNARRGVHRSGRQRANWDCSILSPQREHMHSASTDGCRAHCVAMLDRPGGDNATGQAPRPKVSVSIVTYNHERFIEKTLNSILDQRRTSTSRSSLVRTRQPMEHGPSLKDTFATTRGKFGYCRRTEMLAHRGTPSGVFGGVQGRIHRGM